MYTVHRTICRRSTARRRQQQSLKCGQRYRARGIKSSRSKPCSGLLQRACTQDGGCCACRQARNMRLLVSKIAYKSTDSTKLYLCTDLYVLTIGLLRTHPVAIFLCVYQHSIAIEKQCLRPINIAYSTRDASSKCSRRPVRCGFRVTVRPRPIRRAAVTCCGMQHCDLILKLA